METEVMRRDVVNAFLSVLTPTDADIISRIYGLRGHCPHLEREVAEVHGVTGPRIWQRKIKALAKMRSSAAKILLPACERANA